MKIKATFMVGLVLATGGLVLRLNALAIAELDPTTMWAPGSWEATDQAFWQQTWTDLGNITLVGGLAIITLALHHWIKNTGPTRTNDEVERI